MPIEGRVGSLAFISNFRVFKQEDLFVVVVIFSSVSKTTSELMFQRTVEVSLFAVRISTRNAKNLVNWGSDQFGDFTNTLRNINQQIFVLT